MPKTTQQIKDDQNQRKAKERALKRASGLSRYEFWLTPAQKKAVDKALKK